jgi:prepilin-type N-terminal cleavage/methylation domain-containing protein
MIFMPDQRKGFTLTEVLVVSGLMALLAMMVSLASTGVGRPTADLIGRSQLVEERDLAVVALSRDLGGSLGGPDRSGGKTLGRCLAWQQPTNAEQPLNTDLRLLYDGRTDPQTPVAWAAPNTRILYLVKSNTLVRRENENPTTDFTVARNVDSMKITGIDGRPDAFNIVLCFKYRRLTLTCDLTAEIP